MKYISHLLKIFILIFLLITTFICYLKAQTNNEKLDGLIREGNEYAEKIFDNRKALEKYTEALKLSPNNYEILWKISRAYVDIGEHLPNKTDIEKQKQLEHYEKSLEFAQKAINVNPNLAMGYVRRAIANGRIALFRGVFESLSLVKEVKADCEKAISIDPTEPTPYYLLGRTHTKLCEKPKFVRWPLGIGWANMEDAIKNYEKSIELRPTFIMYRIDCAKAYIELKEYEKARQHLIKIESLPTEDEDDDTFRKEAKELLEKIKDN